MGCPGQELDHPLSPGSLSPSELVWFVPAYGISKQKPYESLPTRCETSSSGSPASTPAVAFVMFGFWLRSLSIPWEVMQALAEGAKGASLPRVSIRVSFGGTQTIEQQINQFILKINPHGSSQGRKILYCTDYIL